MPDRVRHDAFVYIVAGIIMGENEMLKETLTEQMVAVMRLIKKEGSTVCAGTCEHRKPGELHCLTAAQILKCSTTGYKRRLRELVQMGYLERNRVQRDDGAQLAKYTLSDAGEQELAKRAS
jgi:predicted ArsR family transcriptional regulator